MTTIFVSLFVLAAITWAVVGIVKGAAAGGWHTTYRPRALKAAMWLTIGFAVAAIVFGISTWGFGVTIYPWWVLLGAWLVVAALVALAVMLILGLSTVVKILAWAIPVLGVATLVLLGLSSFGVLPAHAATVPPAETAALTTEQVQQMIADNNVVLVDQIKSLIPTAAPAELPAADQPAIDPTAPAAEAPAALAGTGSGSSDPQAPATGLTYVVQGDVVTVSNNGTMIARVTFPDNVVDNNKGEWLKGRTGIGFLYQSAVGNAVTVKVELFEEAAFAADGDSFDWGTRDFGVSNNPDDVIIFGDQLGTYTFTGHSFGLAIAVVKDNTDKAGWALLDRRNATRDNRPEWWIPADGATGEAKQTNK